ncbi:MAG: hypothetical protein LBR10_07305 [Prevotellaceae bacterium]|jgi:hypothetical protein|nr:hypothetical protein [Prevotellaceae bacterium]
MEKTHFQFFVEELNQTMVLQYKTIEILFENQYGYPELDPVRAEICKCLVCGLNQAAITLTNHLLEMSLKTCLIFKYSKKNKGTNTDVFDWFDEGVKKYDSIDLGQSINAACSVGLLTKPQKLRLYDFREQFRNAFSHGSLEKTFGDITAPVKVITTKDFNSIEELGKIAFDRNKDKSVKLTKLPMFRGIAQAMFAQQNSIPYFMEIDKIIRTMLSNLKDK